MIEAIIFDFGNVFINLNQSGLEKALRNLGINEWNGELDKLNKSFEIGKISEIEFIKGFQKYAPNTTVDDVRKAWNSILGEFPLYRLEFLQKLKDSNLKLFLLSNTDAIHINKFEHTVGMSFSRDFYQCFDKVYFSFEMGMRKPNPEIYAKVLSLNGLIPKKTLFVDDKKENTDVAETLGIQVWNLQPEKEDVIDLFAKNFFRIIDSQ
ncbi:MAG TPA: HAD family phosphatase [Flavobacterium sp.]|nr:HAD family phosphatase [Flavobacterium sp.]